MKKVVVGMSGGVDSSVAAYLLKEQGYDVIGVTMQIWQDKNPVSVQENGGCCGFSAVDDARRVAAKLDIPYYVMNFKDEFRKSVMDYFVASYLKGRTPNPCIACNRYVKWEALLQRALSIGADYIATGHYARIIKNEAGRYAVANSVTAKKDQTYALYNLTQEQLARTLMPVGDYTKEEIRKIAADNALLVASKPDSQEICFIPDDDYAGFIERECREKGYDFPAAGNFVREDGTILGRHEGIVHYTIGQRRGLKLPMGERIYVTDIRPLTNEVVLGDNAELFKNEVKCSDINFMGISADMLPLADAVLLNRVKALVKSFEGVKEAGISKEGKAQERVRFIDACRSHFEGAGIKEAVFAVGKIRYGHMGAPCVIVRTAPDEITACFYESVRAVTKGQAAVFYVDDQVACGGVI